MDAGAVGGAVLVLTAFGAVTALPGCRDLTFEGGAHVSDSDIVGGGLLGVDVPLDVDSHNFQSFVSTNGDLVPLRNRLAERLRLALGVLDDVEVSAEGNVLRYDPAGNGPGAFVEEPEDLAIPYEFIDVGGLRDEYETLCEHPSWSQAFVPLNGSCDPLDGVGALEAIADSVEMEPALELLRLTWDDVRSSDRGFLAGYPVISASLPIQVAVDLAMPFDAVADVEISNVVVDYRFQLVPCRDPAAPFAAAPGLPQLPD